MTKFDRRYIDDNAYGDLGDQVDLVDEWRGARKSPREVYADALGNQQVGNEIALTSANNLAIADAATFRPIEIVRLQLPAMWSRSWVVSWSVNLLPVAGAALYTPLASRSWIVIRWGAGGFQHQARIDAGRGGQCTVYGSYVQASVQGFGIPVGLTIRVGASIAPGEAPPRPLLCSEYYGTIGAAGNFTRPIPAFATHVSHIYAEAAGGPSTATTRYLVFIALGPVDIGWMLYQGAGLATVFQQGQPAQPIPGEAISLRYENTAAVAVDDVCLMYRLAI